MTRADEAGFTILELLIGAVMSVLLVAVLYSFYHSQVVALRVQESTANAKEQAEIGLDFILKELRGAGARPAPYPMTCTASPVPAVDRCSGFERFPTATATSISVQYDFRGDAADDPADGCPNDPGERITYSYDASAGTVLRTSVGENGGAAATLVRSVPAAGFALVYRDGAGAVMNPGTGGLTAVQRTEVATVEITISARATRAAPVMPASLDITRTAAVFLRNPGC